MKDHLKPIGVVIGKGQCRAADGLGSVLVWPKVRIAGPNDKPLLQLHELPSSRT